MEIVGKIVAAIVLVVGVIAGISAIVSLPLYWLWNWLTPEIFGLPEITFWQALGLATLSSILFKSSSTKTN